MHTKSDEETAENVANNLVDTARLRIDAASALTRVQSNHATLNLPVLCGWKASQAPLKPAQAHQLSEKGIAFV